MFDVTDGSYVTTDSISDCAMSTYNLQSKQWESDDMWGAGTENFQISATLQAGHKYRIIIVSVGTITNAGIIGECESQWSNIVVDF